MKDAQVTTVLGHVAADELGVVLPHEHLVVDTSVYYQAPADETARELAESPVEITKLGFCGATCSRFGTTSCSPTWSSPSPRRTSSAGWGAATIVDLTLLDVGRDPRALQAIARRTGLNVVMGCGHYIHLAHPPSLRYERVESIAERLLEELANGVGDTGVRPGIIGEIGTWHPLHPDEEKVLRAAARAQRETGLALTVHVHIAARSGHDVLAVLDEEGVDPSRVVLGHLDIAFGHLDSDYDDVLDYHRSLARRGCYVEYDTVGTEVFSPGSAATPPFWTALDLTRARAIARLSRTASATVFSSRTTCSRRASSCATAGSATVTSFATSGTGCTRSG